MILMVCLPFTAVHPTVIFMSRVPLDVLQEFSKPPASTSTAKPNAPSTGAPKSSGTSSSKPAEELAFERELMEGMEKLMAELAGGSSSSSVPPVDSAEDKALREAWEKLMIGELEGDSGLDTAFEEFKGFDAGGKAQTSAGASGAGKKATAGASSGNDFQKKIKETMEKLRNSDDAAKVSAFMGESIVF
jgi:hypothetical protein